jgi:hypothetical protein
MGPESSSSPAGPGIAARTATEARSLDERLERLSREIELECRFGRPQRVSREERWLLFIRWFCWTSFW